MSSGPNQHYIPSLLQRAFGIRPKRVEIWRFEVNELPERRRIKKTGSEEFFYSNPSTDGESTLDDAITAMELKVSRYLRDVRSQSPGDRVDPGVAAAIVSHLAGRTAHVRSTLEDMLVRMCERSEALFAEAGNVEKMMGLDANVPTARFRELVARDLAANLDIARLGVPQKLLEKMAFVLAKEARGYLLEDSQELVGMMLDGMRSDSGNVVRDAHNKGLDQTQTGGMNAFEAALGKLEWEVADAPKGGAILPDCVVVAIRKDGETGTHMLVGSKNIGAVVMGLSSEQLLVGCRPGFRLPIDFEYNVEAARLSHSYFLASRKDKEMSRLQGMIGERLRIEMDAAAEAAFKDKLPASDGDGDNLVGPERGEFGWRTASRTEYELSLEGCGDEETTHRIQKQVAAVVEHVAGAMPLDRLDGITIGSHYAALLRAVDSGIEGGPEVETVPPEVGEGIAKTVLVNRSGQIKGRVVMSSIVGAALVAEDRNANEWALHALVNQLARVGFLRIVDETFPGRLLAPMKNEFEAWLYQNVGGLLDGYFASTVAAPFGDSREIGDELRKLLVKSLDRLGVIAAVARREYRENGDMSKLVEAVLPAVRHVLMFGTDLLGYSWSSGESPLDDGGEVEEALKRAGLVSWFEVYRDHLASFCRRLGRWESFDEFLAFNLHVERLLWSAGLFAWESTEGVRIAVTNDWDPGAFGVGLSGK